MKTKLFYLLFGLSSMLFFVGINSCNKTLDRPAPDVYELKFNFVKPYANLYTCAVPVLNIDDFEFLQTPQMMLWEPNKDAINSPKVWSPATLSIIEKDYGDIAMKIRVSWHDGNEWRMYEMNTMKSSSGKYYIHVPVSGKFSVRVDYLSFCQGCALVNYAHEVWTNYSNTENHTQNAAKTITATLSLFTEDGMPSTLECGQ